MASAMEGAEGTRNYQNLPGVLAGAAQVVGRRPVHQMVANLIPGQSTCLGCGSNRGRGCVRGNQPINVLFSHRCFSHSLPFPSSISKMLK